MGKYVSTKVIELGSAAFRQPKAESHCKFVHGYQLKAKIWFTCNQLNENNWVFDFGGLKELKAKLQNQFDHKLVITKDDPAKSAFKELERYGAVDLVVMDGVGIEKFAEYVFKEADTFVKYKSNNRVWVEQVEVFEHEDNSALYSEPKVEISQSLPTVTPVEIKQVTLTAETNAPKPLEPIPAPLHNKVTTGWSNPFGGTSWGN